MTITVEGVVRVQMIHNGEVVRDDTVHNVTCTIGVSKVAALIGGLSSGGFTYIGFGTGTVTPSTVDVALGNQIARNAASGVGLITTNSAGDTAQVTAGFTNQAVGTTSVSECGLFDATGNLLGHVLIGPYNMQNGDQLTVTWNEVV
jgi:hypothetical protein